MANLTGFHLFPYLPEELRVMIWTFALRPLDRPGVHIFNVVETIRQLDREAHELPRLNWVSLLNTYVVPGNVNATTLSSSLSFSRKHPKVCSTYLLDGGLWTACKESRKVIQKAFGSPKINKPFTKASYRRDSGHPHPLVVFQGRDLFIYRPMQRAREGVLVPGWEPAPVFKPVSRWGRVLCGEPNRVREYYQPNYRHLDKLGHYQDHIAIEWDPYWSSDRAAFEELKSGLMFPSLQRDRIWFVDYGLKPMNKDFALTDLDVVWKREEGMREVFVDAHGGRYVEVYSRKIHLDRHTGERVSSETFDDTGFFMSTNRSLAMLKALLRRDLPDLLGMTWRLPGVSIDKKNWAQWGILAYLPPGFVEGKRSLEASSRTKTQETIEERRKRLGARFWLLA